MASNLSKFSLPIFSLPIFSLSYKGYNQFVKVLLVKLSDMLDLSNFVRLFHCQNFALYSIIVTDADTNTTVDAIAIPNHCITIMSHTILPVIRRRKIVRNPQLEVVHVYTYVHTYIRTQV